jgi:hypothetical protein
MTTLTVQVEANQDDGDRAYDSVAGYFVFSNSNNYNRIGSDNQGMGSQAMTCYFRFLDVDIPSTATINSAKLQYKLHANYSYSSKSCRIYADARTASSAAITSDGDLTGAQGDKTTDYATWNIATSSSSSFLDSADITDVVDEIINFAGWDTSTNNITILLTNPTDADMMDAWELQAKAHEVSAGADAVKLVVDYTAAAAATTQNGSAFMLFLDT